MAADARDDRKQPEWATGALVLTDGTVFWARGVGAVGASVGEVCFNTSITGYQEILTDPSYAGQIPGRARLHPARRHHQPGELALDPASR
jgi:carbamoyl-phosphate synthase small subunit